MSYKTNSPVKQIWLPLDYDWIFAVASSEISFAEFSKAYRESYGIDLHDVFKLSKVDGGRIGCGLKSGLIGSYIVNDFTEYALTNGIYWYSTSEIQDQNPAALLRVYCGDDHVLGYGFNIYLPAQGTTINSIDDLEVSGWNYKEV